jgi:hypothetical protein
VSCINNSSLSYLWGINLLNEKRGMMSVREFVSMWHISSCRTKRLEMGHMHKEVACKPSDDRAARDYLVHFNEKSYATISFPPVCQGQCAICLDGSEQNFDPTDNKRCS